MAESDTRDRMYDTFYAAFKQQRDLGFRLPEIRALNSGALRVAEQDVLIELYDFWLDEIETQMELAKIEDEGEDDDICH